MCFLIHQAPVNPKLLSVAITYSQTAMVRLLLKRGELPTVGHVSLALSQKVPCIDLLDLLFAAAPDKFATRTAQQIFDLGVRARSVALCQWAISLGARRDEPVRVEFEAIRKGFPPSDTTSEAIGFLAWALHRSDRSGDIPAALASLPDEQLPVTVRLIARLVRDGKLSAEDYVAELLTIPFLHPIQKLIHSRRNFSREEMEKITKRLFHCLAFEDLPSHAGLLFLLSRNLLEPEDFVSRLKESGLIARLFPDNLPLLEFPVLATAVFQADYAEAIALCPQHLFTRHAGSLDEFFALAAANRARKCLVALRRKFASRPFETGLLQQIVNALKGGDDPEVQELADDLQTKLQLQMAAAVSPASTASPVQPPSLSVSSSTSSFSFSLPSSSTSSSFSFSSSEFSFAPSPSAASLPTFSFESNSPPSSAASSFSFDFGSFSLGSGSSTPASAPSPSSSPNSSAAYSFGMPTSSSPSSSQGFSFSFL